MIEKRTVSFEDFKGIITGGGELLLGALSLLLTSKGKRKAIGYTNNLLAIISGQRPEYNGK